MRERRPHILEVVYAKHSAAIELAESRRSIMLGSLTNNDQSLEKHITRVEMFRYLDSKIQIGTLAHALQRHPT